jgi:hypothetical protein
MGRIIEGLGGRYITADDVGTTLVDLAIMREVTRHAAGATAAAQQALPVTAFGLFGGPARRRGGLPRPQRLGASADYWRGQEQKAGAAPCDLGPSEAEAVGSLGLAKAPSSPRAAPPRRAAASRPFVEHDEDSVAAVLPNRAAHDRVDQPARHVIAALHVIVVGIGCAAAGRERVAEPVRRAEIGRSGARCRQRRDTAPRRAAHRDAF